MPFFQIDSYSAFFDNGGFSQTDLDAKLKEQNVDTVYLSGLALDFCVFYSAMDAIRLKYRFVIFIHKYRNYSCVPKKRAGPNKRAGWKLGQN